MRALIDSMLKLLLVTCVALKVLAAQPVPLTITVQPEGSTVPVGGIFSVSVQASGSGPLGFQWQFNGFDLLNATNNSLLLNAVQPANAGHYRVMVSGTEGAVLSQSAILVVEVTPDFEWARHIGGVGAEEARSVAVDAAGNTYVAGAFANTVSLGNTNLTCVGGADIFVARYDVGGNFVWVRQAGGTNFGWESSLGIAVDNTPNVYITGNFYGQARFGETNITSHGGSDVFIAKYDENGNLEWVRQVGGVSDDQGLHISIGVSNDVAICGWFFGRINFDTNIFVDSNTRDMFVAKYDTEGRCLWARQAGGPGWDQGTAVAVSPLGEVYVAGDFVNTAAFGANQTLSSAGQIDTFLVKYAADSTLQWVRRIGGTEFDRAYGLSIEPSGDVYATGYFQAWASFGSTNLFSRGRDLFLARYAPDGELRWVYGSGGPDVGAIGVAVDPSGFAYIAGLFYGSTGSLGSIILTNSGVGADPFVAKFDPVGRMLWARQAGGADHDVGFSIAADQIGQVRIAGTFRGNADFSPHTLTNAGSGDVFVAKLRAGSVIAPTLTIATAGDSVQLIWPTTSVGFVLEAASRVSGPFTSNFVIHQMEATGLLNRVTVSVTNGFAFFRLKRP
jgi:hypothetical protein